MATAPITVTDQVTLNFVWKGPNNSQAGRTAGLQVRVVHLEFQDDEKKVWVQLPQRIFASASTRLPFTCSVSSREGTERSQSSSGVVKDVTFEQLSLQVTQKQIRNLVLKTHILDKSPDSGWSCIDASTVDITKEKPELWSNENVEFKIPDKLEIGQTYCIEMTSKELALSARLVKVASNDSTSFEIINLNGFRTEVAVFLRTMLYPSMTQRMGEFGQELGEQFDIKKANGLINNSVLGFAAIQSEIQKMDNAVLKEIVVNMRQVEMRSTGQTPMGRAILEKPVCHLCFSAIGVHGLANIMRSSLMDVVKTPISNQVSELIDQHATQFATACKSYSVS